MHHFCVRYRLVILAFALVSFFHGVICWKSGRFPLGPATQKEASYPADPLGRAVKGKEWVAPFSDGESWDAKHRHMSAYVSSLRQRAERKPGEGFRLPKTPVRSQTVSTLIQCPNDNCSASEDVVLTKYLRQQLALQLIAFIQPERLLLVTNEKDKDLCIRMGRFLYMSSTPTTCKTFANLYGYYPDVIITASDTDDGEEISNMMMVIGKRITRNQLTVNNLIVFLPSSSTVLRPPGDRLNYCVLQAKGGGVEFKEVFTFGPASSVPAEEVVGWWSPGRPEETHIPYRGDLAVPSDFRGNVVRIVILEIMPYITYKKTAEGKLEADGYVTELCLLLAQELNFTIEWVESPDGEFGISDDNGTFTGVVGVLQRKEADIAAPPLNINLNRAKEIDFSPPIDYAYVKLLIYRGQGKEDIDWYTYVTGFHWAVWLSVLGIWFLMAIGLVVVAEKDLQVTVYNYLFAFMGALAQQGTSHEPQCTRGRIVFLSYWLGTLIIFSSYTASLTSQLAVVYTVDPFTTLKEALTTAGYSVALQKGTSYYTNVQNMAKRDEPMRLFYQQLLDKPQLKVPGNAEGIQLVQQGKYAFFQDTVSVNYEIKNNCSFSWLGPPYFPEFACMGYMKNLSYANAISEYIIRATDSGIARKLMKKWMGLRATCDSTPLLTLGFSKTVSAFSLLALGMLLGTSILLVERWVHSGSPFGARNKRHTRRALSLSQIKSLPRDLR